MLANIVICNRSTTVDNAFLAAMVPALQQQISEHFVPFWRAGATLHFCGLTEQPNPVHWPLYVMDHSDQEGDLGYHEEAGVPTAKVFAADDARYGVKLSVTISHELLEMLADPHADKSVMIDGERQIFEVCDPVQADSDGYDIDGVRVSNFVTPLWFKLGGPPGRFDFRALLTAPCPTLRPGGYRMFFDGYQWQSVMARHPDGSLGYRAIRAAGRSKRRAGRSTG